MQLFDAISNPKAFEWIGVAVSMAGALMVATNSRASWFGFLAMLISNLLLGVWAVWTRDEPMLLLQAVYLLINLMGLVRWDRKPRRDLPPPHRSSEGAQA